MSSSSKSRSRTRVPLRRLTKDHIEKTIKELFVEFPDLGEGRNGYYPRDHTVKFVIRQALEKLDKGSGYSNDTEKYFSTTNLQTTFKLLEKFFKDKGILAAKYKKLKFSQPRRRKSSVKKSSKGSRSKSAKRSGDCRKPCPAGKVCNRASRRCVKESGRAGKAVSAGRSPPQKKSKKRSPKTGCPKPCEKDKICNPETRRCVKLSGRVGKKLSK